MVVKHITEEELVREGAKLSEEELTIINNVAEGLVAKEPRPLILLAVAAHLLGIVVQQSDGTMDKESVLKWMDVMIQL